MLDGRHLRGALLDLAVTPSPSWLDAAAIDVGGDPYRVYWADGPRRRLLGWGLAAAERAEGSARFQGLAEGERRIRRSLLRSMPASAPEPELLPLFLAFGFWPRPEWPDVPAASLSLPRLLLDAEPGFPARLWAVARHADAAEALLERGRRALASLAREQEASSPSDTLSALAASRGVDGASPLPPSALLAQVTRAIAALRAGRAEKLVLATAARAAAAEGAASAVAWLEARARAEPEAFHFLAAPRPDHAWLGASPERLVAVQGGRLRSMALAGSRPRGVGPAADAALGEGLLASAKDAREHALVVQDLCARLGALGLRPVAGATGLKRLSRLQHLETPLEADMPTDGSLDLWNLVAALHPSPALGGWPREAALELLAELEQLGEGRGLYGGGIGWLDGRGEGDVTVGIRGLRLAGGQAWAYAGAGLLAESDPEAEAQEIAIKLAAAAAC